MSEAKRTFKSWRMLARTPSFWPDAFSELKHKEALDSVGDLMPLDVGHLYREIAAKDIDRKIYGYIPAMASCSYGQIGALNAESFCERVLSIANMVLTEGNTLLGDEELSMLVVLRMNRQFMDFMRTHYYEELKGAFSKVADAVRDTE